MKTPSILEPQHRTALAYVTFQSQLAPPSSTLTHQIKRRAFTLHPPLFAACLTWTALSTKHHLRLHKLASRSPPSLYPAVRIPQYYPPTDSLHQSSPATYPVHETLEIPPDHNCTTTITIPRRVTPTSGLPTFNIVLCIARAHSIAGLLLAGNTGRFEVAA